MGKGNATYTTTDDNPAKTCRARGSDLRASFKNTHEAAAAIRKMPLVRAKTYLRNVLAHKEIIPYRHFNKNIGRHAQMKQWKASQGRWPKKSAELLLSLLQNAESNASAKGLETERLRITHIQVNAAMKHRRRTYRAHGRIGPYMRSPCHVEMVLTEDASVVPTTADGTTMTKKESKKKAARQRLKEARRAAQ